MEKTELKSDWPEFVAEIRSREITRLIHFTETVNLMSIVESGRLLATGRLAQLDPETLDYILQNDEWRLDGLEEYINLSIQFPNSFLFRRFRQRKTQAFVYWCVLLIDPKFIYYRDTLFSVSNAASTFSRLRGITGDLEKFRSLFAEEITITSSTGSRTVTRRGLPACYPTDEQAEVLVRCDIPYSDVYAVCFEKEEDLSVTRSAFRVLSLDSSKFAVDPSLFRGRT